MCEPAPWEDGELFGGLTGDTIALPETIQERMHIELPIRQYTASHRRTMTWGTVNMVASGRVSADKLLTSRSSENGKLKGKFFTLHPDSSIPSPVLLQWVHVGSRAIPDDLANISCTKLGLLGLLGKLNDVLGTEYSLSEPDLSACLEHMLNTCSDFGQVYALLRCRWNADVGQVLPFMEAALKNDLAMRREVVEGHCIRRANLSPRRLWDLFSNRVIPVYVAASTPRSQLPRNVWTVSHSWMDEKDRQSVITEINGKEWPVPIPCRTTLSHIRIELLNLGAEYVWLDVLCLRQEGQEEWEAKRKEEWTIDIPTIGSVFRLVERHGNPCITYFNGLGLAVDTSQSILRSEHHWFNRVWTLQETGQGWLPGGLTGEPIRDGPALFRRVRDNTRISQIEMKKDLRSLSVTIKERSCASEIDRVSGLAYILGCKTLPLYKEDTPVEEAWNLLIKHLPRHVRTSYIFDFPLQSPLVPWATWGQFMAADPSPIQPVTQLESLPTKGQLRLLDESQLLNEKVGQYFHSGYVVGPSCRIERGPPLNEEQSRGLERARVTFDGQEPFYIDLLIRGFVLPDIPYTLLHFGTGKNSHWVLLEAVGESRVNGQRALEAVKWATLQTQQEPRLSERLHLSSLKDTTVIYISGEEVRAKSRHVVEYFRVIEAGKCNGQAVTRPL